MRVAVVGHVEWVQFGRVEQVPATGEIVHASETWEEPGGGGAVAAVQLARLAGTATLFTVLGRDDFGRRAREELERLGVRVEAAVVPQPQRRAFVHVDGRGERTITVLGGKLVPRSRDRLPWAALERMDAVYFASGDAEALQAARRAKALVATARELGTLQQGGVELDALVGSGEDEGELYRFGELEPPPRLVVTTAGALGGWAQPGGPYRAAAIPGPFEDTYGCGDCFAAALAFGLGSGLARDEAIALAARCGAAQLTVKGVAGGGAREQA